MMVLSKEFRTGLLRKFVFTVSFLLMTALLSRAEMYTPLHAHNCLRPVRPFEFSSQWERDQYLKDVEAYKNCLQRFIEEQKQAIQRHQEATQRHKEAAEAAIEEWKDFVKRGLK